MAGSGSSDRMRTAARGGGSSHHERHARAGVGILAGCDSMIAGFCVHDEVAAMVRGGMTPLAA
jgi:hypothetical protein